MNNQVHILTEAEIRRAAPSVYAPTAHPDKTTESYAFVPTSQVLDALRGEGWVPTAAQQTRVRHADNKVYTKHMLRLRNPELPALLGGEAAPELILLNSHDRAISYRLSAGVFRFVCMNGCVVADSVFASIMVKHAHNAVDRVLEGSFEVIRNVDAIRDNVERLASAQLTEGEALAFAEAATVLRYGDLEAAPINPEQLLLQRRAEDNGMDAWHVFNRIQENTVRGGLQGVSSNGRRVRTGALYNLHRNVGVNKDLWELANTVAGIKLAA